MSRNLNVCHSRVRTLRVIPDNPIKLADRLQTLSSGVFDMNCRIVSISYKISDAAQCAAVHMEHEVHRSKAILM